MRGVVFVHRFRRLHRFFSGVVLFFTIEAPTYVEASTCADKTAEATAEKTANIPAGSVVMDGAEPVPPAYGLLVLE